MATFLPTQSNGTVAEGHNIQLIQVGAADAGGKGFTAIADHRPTAVPSGTGFVLAQGGQTQHIGNVLQHITMSAETQQLALGNTNYVPTVPRAILPKAAPPQWQPRKRSKRWDMSKYQSANPGVNTELDPVTVMNQVTANNTQEAENTSTQEAGTTSKRKSRRKGTSNKRVAVKPVPVVPPPVVEAPQVSRGGGSRRKRKSPVRTTMADLLGEPEFTEMYYFEETDDEEDDTHTSSIMHLMKERQRRRDMGGMFTALQNLVTSPGRSHIKTSRKDMLIMSVNEVKRLKKAARQLKTAKDALRDKNRQLRNRLAQLLNVTTDIQYESEEEELIEKVGVGGGYQSSSSAPDNDDDDGSVDWMGSLEMSDGEGEEIDDVKQEASDDDEEVDVKVELPEDEDDSQEEEPRIVRVKQEPASDVEDTEQGNSNIEAKSADLTTYVTVQVKLEPGEGQETASNTEQAKVTVTKQVKVTGTHWPEVTDKQQPKVTATQQPKVTATQQPKVTATQQPKVTGPSSQGRHPSSTQRTISREEGDVDVDFEYDRYARVKLEPRSPVRRALFGGFGNKDSQSRTGGNHDNDDDDEDLVDHYSVQPLPLSLQQVSMSGNEDSDDLAASSMSDTDQDLIIKQEVL